MAALARANHRYQDWIDYQARRLQASDVRVVLGREATGDDVLAAAVDVVAVATGASPRRPDVPGREMAHVVTISEALTGTASSDRRLIIAEDDGPAPLSVAATSPASAIRSRLSTRAPASPDWSASTRPVRCTHA